MLYFLGSHLQFAWFFCEVALNKYFIWNTESSQIIRRSETNKCSRNVAELKNQLNGRGWIKMVSFLKAIDYHSFMLEKYRADVFPHAYV